MGTVIGSIVFNDCSGRTLTDFMSTDARYHVESDGTVKLNTRVTLHNGYNMFSVHAWDSMGKKHTASVRVEHQGRDSHQNNQQEDVDEIESAQNESPSGVLVLEFPKSDGLRRRKRGWTFPPISLVENDVRGPYPKPVVQIKSHYAKETTMAYTITGEGADLPPVGIFTIAKNTGWLSVSRSLDREVKAKYVLLVNVYSPTDPTIKEDPLEVIIQVMDQNDNSPVFTQNPFLGSVPEAAKIGVEFMAITATDADDPDTDNAAVRYSIISQTPPEPTPNMFDINPVTGAIRVNADGLDRAKYPEYTLEIQAADAQGEGRITKGKAIITVTDNNDKASTKARWVIPPISLMENNRGPYPKQIVQIKSSHTKEAAIVYTITGEGADQPPVGLFTIPRNTGWLSVSGSLDREAKAKYVLLVHAHSPTDPSIKEDPMEVIVQVMDQNDNTPVFTQNPFLGSVPGAAKIGVEFMTITATDADDPDTDNADVRYSIISQTPPEPTPNMFGINSVTGAIRVNADGLDRAKYPEYTLEIQAADMKGHGRATKGKAIITVTDNSDKASTESPGIWEISPICIPENSRGPFPEQLAQIKYRHAKQSEVVYSITGEGADQGLFTVNKYSGKLSVTKPLDRETKHEYVLQAHATVNGRKEHLNDITIHVIDQNDNKPVFIQGQFRGSVPKTSKQGFEFMTISATDADDSKTGNIRYSIMSQDPPLPQPNMFEINSYSGEIQVNDEGFDIEKYPEYTLEIQAADMQGHGRATKGKAIITVTDNSDKASAKGTWVIPPIQVPENALGRLGQYPIKIVQIKSSHAKVTRVKYVISGGGADLPPVGLFIMEKNTGELFAARPLDRETRDKYTLQAHVIGDNMHDVTVDFTIHVVDQNDNRPVFTQDPFIGSVSDASKIGFEFMTISATDADDPNTDNADIRYSIISQSPPEPSPNIFAVNPVTGAVRVNAEGLDSVKYSKYVLKIQAADMQGNGYSTLGDAVILVHDIKEETMTESPGIWEISPICIPENSRGPFPEQLAQITSKHAKQSEVVYSITGEGADQGLFTVNKYSGKLSVTKPLDRETKHEYVLQAHATVNGRKEHLNDITIHVIDQNDNKPVFTQGQFRGSVPKTSKQGFEFMTISATDADDSKTGNIRYSIMSQDPPLPQPNMFEINSYSGEIQVNDEGFDIEEEAFLRRRQDFNVTADINILVSMFS
ncbi:B-cadherin-like isoform X1 [Clarias magur]|uniref:B-cadherin-like isoform X1 n=1 Tax=Clarias magur TaxID=1594786 RepID=A0A8J4UIY0_CLAMG|nr:B-cadherin-like isoform X1 [Clarias magur]